MKRIVLIFGLALALVTGTLSAQPDPRMIGTAMAKNQETLRDYTWQSRVEVAVDGEENKVDLYQVRYNFDGELEKTRLGGAAKEQKAVRGPLRKRIAKNKKSKAGEFAQAVNLQLRRYMSPQSFQKAISSAFVRKGNGSIKLRSEDVIVQGDAVEFELVEATKQPISMRITSIVDEESVKVTINFQKLEGGPNYPARQVVSTKYGKKKLVITTENFDYNSQGG